jgi:hypothetical protein
MQSEGAPPVGYRVSSASDSETARGGVGAGVAVAVAVAVEVEVELAVGVATVSGVALAHASRSTRGTARRIDFLWNHTARPALGSAFPDAIPVE